MSFLNLNIDEGVATVVAACIGGLFLIANILITYWQNGKQQKDNKEVAKQIESFRTDQQKLLIDKQSESALRLQDHQAASNDEQAEKQAKREYRYEARKRLYEELYPIVFEITEASDSAASRIINFAKRYEESPAKLLKDLKPQKDSDNYYLKTTIYRLFLPLALYRIMQRRLTHVDLNLDDQLHKIYQLLHALSRTFGDDREIAKIANLKYHPERNRDFANPASDQEEYTPQGLLRGKLDCIVESLLERSEKDPIRCMTFYEFSNKWSSCSNDWLNNFSDAIELFEDFNPNKRPVLWIALKAQLLLHRAIFDGSKSDKKPTISRLSTEDEDKLSCTEHDKDHASTYAYLLESKASHLCVFGNTRQTDDKN